MNISKKQKSYHVLSVICYAFVILCFVILGGGTESKYGSVEAKNEAYVNVELPDAVDRNLAGNRLEAIEQERMEANSRKRKENLEQNSFDWLDIASDVASNVAINKVLPASTVNDKVETSVNPKSKQQSRQPKVSYNGSVSVNANENIERERIMRNKRAEIEKEWGINLSDYGYTKYETPDYTDHVETVSKIEEKQEQKDNCFYGLDDYVQLQSGHIKAMIHGEHKNVTKGSMIKLRLLEPIVIDGYTIPQNSFIYGQLSYKSGRAMVNVENINYRDRIFPFAASLYDRDGFEGLYVPDNILDDTGRNAAGQMISSSDINITSTSGIIRSATNALANSVKTAVNSVAREPKITIAANYLITLKIDK